MVRSLELKVSSKADPIIERIADLLKRQVNARCGARLFDACCGERTIALDLDDRLGKEGFKIEDGLPETIRIIGQDARGLLAGVGKFLRTSRYGAGDFTPGDWRGTSAPEKPLRGMYFASHFHNFYHEAPIEKIQRYVEELALWGINAIFVWFDMHHFYGIDDPAAQAMIVRLKAILKAATDIGIRAGLLFLANEAYANSPENLRADWTAGHDGYHHPPGGHYHVELCPSKPGAPELLLRWAEEKLEAFADVDVRYLCIWPYDQGGCTCSQCKPWGVNGYLRMAQPIAELYRRRYPQGKVVLSTWYFDHFTDGEWDGLDRVFRTRPDWVDYLLADDNADRFPEYPLQHGVPGGLPMVNFSEISMYRASPWGGFGANPLPQHLQALWDTSGTHLSGGLPYSEGIYEDINKAICAQFYWQEKKAALDTVREYIAYEYGREVLEPTFKAVQILERTLPRRRVDEAGKTRFVLHNADGVDEAYALLQQVDGQLAPHVRSAWRWRILYLRALVDYELAHNGFAISERCEDAFRELTEIYHAQKAGPWVAPPTREARQHTA